LNRSVPATFAAGGGGTFGASSVFFPHAIVAAARKQHAILMLREIVAGVNVALLTHAAESRPRSVQNRPSSRAGLHYLCTPGFPLRIRIKELPLDRRHVEGFDLRRFEKGQAYDVSARLGEFLLVMGYANVEMRRFDRDTADDGPRRRRSDPPIRQR
jgi:hypothetical protein